MTSSSPVPNSVEYSALALRLALGTVALAHALLKPLVFTFPGTIAFFESVGLPGFLAFVVFAVELVAGTLLVVGWLTRWAALALIPVFLGATFTVHWQNGWLFTNPNGGWEFTAFAAVVALALFLLGDTGRLALARALARRRAAGESSSPT